MITVQIVVSNLVIITLVVLRFVHPCNILYTGNKVEFTCVSGESCSIERTELSNIQGTSSTCFVDFYAPTKYHLHTDSSCVISMNYQQFPNVDCSIGQCYPVCSSHEQCVPSGESYSCICGELWEGQDCNTPICSPECLSQATCKEKTPSLEHVCECSNNHFDPNSNCVTCLAFWEGVDCNDCIRENVDPTTCDKCVSHYTTESNCQKCEKNYDIVGGCEDCIRGYSFVSGCTKCEGYWSGANCSICPYSNVFNSACNGCKFPHYSFSSFCTECTKGYSLDTNCTGTGSIGTNPLSIVITLGAFSIFGTMMIIIFTLVIIIVALHLRNKRKKMKTLENINNSIGNEDAPYSRITGNKERSKDFPNGVDQSSFSKDFVYQGKTQDYSFDDATKTENVEPDAPQEPQPDAPQVDPNMENTETNETIIDESSNYAYF